MLRRSKDIFVRTGIKAEEKAAAEAAVAAAALKEALESVLEGGGLAKVHEMVADPNAEEAVAAAARSLLASLPDNVSCHDVAAAIWLAFFSRCQRCRC